MALREVRVVHEVRVCGYTYTRARSQDFSEGQGCGPDPRTWGSISARSGIKERSV